jgi:hypothetical protein
MPSSSIVALAALADVGCYSFSDLPKGARLCGTAMPGAEFRSE